MTGTVTRRDLLRLMGVGAGAFGIGGLVACAPSADNDDDDSGGTSETGDAAQDFSFASWSLADDASKAEIQKLMDAFASANDVSVSGVPYAYNDYLNQLTLQVQGGQFTGAAQLDIAWLAALSALGKLRDLGSVAEGVDYTESGLLSGQVDGVQYGLPWTTAAIGLIANREHLDQVGVTEPPATLADFEAVLTELKGAGFIPYAASTKVAQLKDILIWMETFGSPLIDGDQVTIGDDASIEAVTWYKKLYDQGLIAPDVERLDARNLFSQGRAAMYDDAIVGKAFVVGESPDPELLSKLTALPRPVLAAGDTPRAVQWGHAIVVVDGEGADTAAEFAKFVTSDEELVLGYFEALGLPPTTDTALASDTVQNDPFTAEFGERITATATPNPFWRFPQYAQMETAVAEQVQAVLTGASSPADAMRAAGEAVQGLV
ncbi:sugar ABC transporter substrate-binding protein [Jiangella asiatica]|uniref:sugar ABC transporter substrate-binding protein n=1 Tax=Jiangella asiatica TaxID=2530372 RepID=UPI00193CFBE3|nr:extracellular solute-binding protein [Jiangella asiatica]